MQETAGGVTTDFYYSDQWQVLEERVGGNTTVQYVWSPVYVDAMVLRDRDSDGDGTLEERLWVAQDANYNVSAIFDNSGNVVEHCVFDPFGQATVLDAEWNVRSDGSAYDWLYLHQGGRYDVTSGLYHFRFRDYSPTLGRWISLDPLSYAAGDVNLYRSLGNNLTYFTDPFGLYEGGVVASGEITLDLLTGQVSGTAWIWVGYGVELPWVGWVGASYYYDISLGDLFTIPWPRFNKVDCRSECCGNQQQGGHGAVAIFPYSKKAGELTEQLPVLSKLTDALSKSGIEVGILISPIDFIRSCHVKVELIGLVDLMPILKKLPYAGPLLTAIDRVIEKVGGEFKGGVQVNISIGLCKQKDGSWGVDVATIGIGLFAEVGYPKPKKK